MTLTLINLYLKRSCLQGRSIKIAVVHWKGKEKDRPRQGYVFFAFQHEVNLSITSDGAHRNIQRKKAYKAHKKVWKLSLYTTA